MVDNRQTVQHCGETRIALVGYSQGADAAGDLAAEIGRGGSVVAPDRLVGVGLLPDPQRAPTDIQVGPQVGGAGAIGARPGGLGLVHSKVRTICATGDLYCSTDDEDFLLRFGGYLARASGTTSDPVLHKCDAAALLDAIRSRGGIAALPTDFDEETSGQRAQLAHFYGSGTHMSYGTYPVGDGHTAITWMHDYLANLA